MRGPRVSSTGQQLATCTAWGALDFLVLDMPPGTGDIQMTLCQQLQIAGAVIVSTPQRLTYVDVVKGVEMFASLQVPTLALVENLAHFDGDDGKRYYPFGEPAASYAGELRERYGIETSFTLPIDPAVSRCSDGGPVPWPPLISCSTHCR